MSTKDTNPKDLAATNRVPLGLLSPIASAYWAVAQLCGALKYGQWNWRAAGVRSSVYINAAKRHLDAFNSGERLDPVDGTHHLGNVMACCAILLDAEAAGMLTDDRPPVVDLRPAYAECEAAATSLIEKYKGLAPKHYTAADTRAAAPEEPAPVAVDDGPPREGDLVEYTSDLGEKVECRVTRAGRNRYGHYHVWSHFGREPDPSTESWDWPEKFRVLERAPVST